MRNPLIPMLAITGIPEKDRIYEIVDKYAECGITQLMLYPRDGCELSYLSDKWFETMENFITAGKRHDMRFWLYDEYNYPSGGCKGLVMKQKPAFCISYIKAEFDGKHFIPKHYFNEKYPNILNPEAVDFFIESTHEKYKKRLGKYFGKEIAGIFTDEPSFYYGIWEDDELPYYDGLYNDYCELSGNDFHTDYDLYYSGKDAKDFIKNCYALFADRMYESFVGKINTWCEKNNLYMTGHLMNDDNPSLSVRANGNLLKQLSGFSLPAIDDIFSDASAARVLMSLSAIQYASRGKDGAAAELFALGPCDISFEKMKLMIWYTALFGVNHFFLAIGHFDIRGNAYRRYYYNDFSPFSPQLFAYAKLGEEAEKAVKTAKSGFVPDVYVRFPWALAADGIFAENGINKRWGELLKALTKYQITYLVIQDEKIFDKPIAEALTEGFLLGGKLFGSAEDMADVLKPRQLYTEKNGTLPDDIVVRRYSGKTVLLNLSDKSKTLLFDNKEIELPPYAVKESDNTDKKYKTLFSVAVSETAYEDKNLSGAVFDSSGKFEFELKEDLKFIFAVRAYPESACVFLDKTPLSADGECSVLPGNFNALYKQSAAHVLKKGRHELFINGEQKNYKYLPDVIFSGDFHRQGNTFSYNRFDKTEVPHFGKYAYYFEVQMPKENNISVCIKGINTPVKLYADGEILGCSIAPPYVFELPYSLVGKKVFLRAETASDFSPVFGNTALAELADGTPKWCSGFTPSFEKPVNDVVLELLTEECI